MVSSFGFLRSPYAIFLSVLSGLPVAAAIAGQPCGPIARRFERTYKSKSEGCIPSTIYHLWDKSIPAVGWNEPENGPMSQRAIIQTVGANLKALRKSPLTPEGRRSINKFAIWTGVPNGTLDRIERGKTDPQLSHLIKIAMKFQSHGIRIWHLFVADLDPMRLPAYLTNKEMQFHAQAEEAYVELQKARTGGHRYSPPSS